MVTFGCQESKVSQVKSCCTINRICFGLMLNVPVNNFSVMLGRSHRFLGITSTFLGVKQNLCHNELFRDGCRKSHEIAFSMTVQRNFNVSLPRAHYDTLFTERDKMIKACDAWYKMIKKPVMPKSCENKFYC